MLYQTNLDQLEGKSLVEDPINLGSTRQLTHHDVTRPSSTTLNSLFKVIAIILYQTTEL